MTTPSGRKGLLALSPLIIFLILYLVSCIIAKDFYSIPISAAFLLASVYAVLICKGKTLEEIELERYGAPQARLGAAPARETTTV